MKFRLVASLLVIAVLGALVYLTQAPSDDGPAASPQSSSSPGDEKALKDLKID